MTIDDNGITLGSSDYDKVSLTVDNRRTAYFVAPSPVIKINTIDRSRSAIEVRIPEEDKLVVHAYYDGTVEFGEGITPDQAARKFWECMGKYAPRHISI